VKYLGIIFDKQLPWKHHIDRVLALAVGGMPTPQPQKIIVEKGGETFCGPIGAKIVNPALTQLVVSPDL